LIINPKKQIHTNFIINDQERRKGLVPITYIVDCNTKIDGIQVSLDCEMVQQSSLRED